MKVQGRLMKTRFIEIRTDATLGASGLWLGTRTEAGGTATLA